MTPRRITQVPRGCWVACIASLTDIDHDELSALVPEVLDDATWTDYHNAVVDLIHACGWTYAALGSRVPRGFAIGFGKTPRGCDHAVVVLDGKNFWDPHPDRAGIDVIKSYELVVPIVGVA